MQQSQNALFITLSGEHTDTRVTQQLVWRSPVPLRVITPAIAPVFSSDADSSALRHSHRRANATKGLGTNEAGLINAAGLPETCGAGRLARCVYPFPHHRCCCCCCTRTRAKQRPGASSASQNTSAERNKQQNPAQAGINRAIELERRKESSGNNNFTTYVHCGHS